MTYRADGTGISEKMAHQGLSQTGTLEVPSSFQEAEQINDSCMLVRVNILGKPMAPERLIPWSRSMKYNAHSLVRNLQPCNKIGSRMHVLLSYFLLARPELLPRSTRRSVFTAFSSIPATFAGFPSLRTYICTRRDMATTTGVQQFRGMDVHSHLINLSNCPQKCGAAQTCGRRREDSRIN